jgi:hypothetical protein
MWFARSLPQGRDTARMRPSYTRGSSAVQEVTGVFVTKDQAAKIDQLFLEVAEKGLNRREMIQRAGVPGISAWALTFAFVQKSQGAMAQGDDNLLGVDPTAPLDVGFKGGYGDDYAINVNENLYGALYPEAEITYVGTQRLMEQYQDSVVDGNPPDVTDNSGAGNFSTAHLYRDGQLADLADLMAAPAYGQEDITFADSLADGTQDDGRFDGKQYYLNYAEASIVDGAGPSHTFFQVMLPMAKPGLIAMGIFNFLGQLNQFLLPPVLIYSQDKYMLSQGLNFMAI